MQIRCYSCKMPISVSQAMVHQALNIMQEDDLVHFDFRCPRCRKANRVSREQLLHFAPGWEYVPLVQPEEKVEGKETEKSTPETKPKTKAEPKTESKAKVKPKPKPKPKTTPKAEAKSKTKAKSGTKAKTATKSKAKPKK